MTGITKKIYMNGMTEMTWLTEMGLCHADEF